MFCSWKKSMSNCRPWRTILILCRLRCFGQSSGTGRYFKIVHESLDGRRSVVAFCVTPYLIPTLFKANVHTALDRANLLTGVRNDIEYITLLYAVTDDLLTWFYSAYKSTNADMLLAERGRIDNSHQMTEEILTCVLFLLELLSCSKYCRQAYETRSEFSRQRMTIANMNNRMVGVLSTCSHLGVPKYQIIFVSLQIKCLVSITWFL